MGVGLAEVRTQGAHMLGGWVGLSVFILRYSVLSIIRDNGREGIALIIEKHDNPNFVFYTPTAPSARHRPKNVLLSHTSHCLCARARAPG
jgi:hypothetical protein